MIRYRVSQRALPPITQEPEYQQSWACHGWTVLPAHGFLLDGESRPVSVTRMEASLLVVLIKHSPSSIGLPPVVDRHVLSDWLWGDVVVEYDNAIDKLTCSLRKKLGDGAVFRVLPRRGLTLLDLPRRIQSVSAAIVVETPAP